jgi:hypothetical protein
MVYTLSSGQRRPPPERQPLVDLAALEDKQQRLKQIHEMLPYTVHERMKRRLQDELTEVEQFIQRYVPIYRLPPDILMELAYILSRVHNNGAWLFSAICRTWRAAALCNPRAWTDIHLTAQEDKSKGVNRFHWKAIYPHSFHQAPSPDLCIKRAGVLPLSLEFHGPIMATRDMKNFLSTVMPYVGRICIHERGGSCLPVSHPTPKLKELVIVPEEGHCLGGYNEVQRMLSRVLFNIFDTTDPAKCKRALNQLWVARFHKINWEAAYLAAFQQLRDITLHDCTCSRDDNIHQFLQANCETLEHLHLSLTVSARSSSSTPGTYLFSKVTHIFLQHRK